MVCRQFSIKESKTLQLFVTCNIYVIHNIYFFTYLFIYLILVFNTRYVCTQSKNKTFKNANRIMIVLSTDKNGFLKLF